MQQIFKNAIKKFQLIYNQHHIPNKFQTLNFNYLKHNSHVSKSFYKSI